MFLYNVTRKKCDRAVKINMYEKLILSQAYIYIYYPNRFKICAFL